MNGRALLTRKVTEVVAASSFSMPHPRRVSLQGSGTGVGCRADPSFKAENPGIHTSRSARDDPIFRAPEQLASDSLSDIQLLPWRVPKWGADCWGYSGSMVVDYNQPAVKAI